MKLGGTSVVLVTVLVLAGCGAPPISEAEYERRLTALDGVTSAYFSRNENLPFIYDFRSAVGVGSSITSAQLLAVVDELEAMPGFSSYTVYEMEEHPRGVSWDFRDFPSASHLEFVSEMWPVAAALPQESSVEFNEVLGANHTRLEWSTRETTDPESNALIATDFASQIAQADSGAELRAGIPHFGFEGVPGRCAGLVEAVETLVDTAEVTSVDVRCSNQDNRIVASVLDDATATLGLLEGPLRSLGFTLVVTPDEFRADAAVPEELLADITAVVTVAQQVPGAPSALSTSSGIDFGTTDEQTARALVAAVQSMPEYDRISITLHVSVPESDSVLTISKNPGQRLYLDPLIAIAKQPGFWSLSARTNAVGVISQDLHLAAPSVEEAVAILHKAGFRDAAGLMLRVNVYENDRALIRLSVVVQEDGSVAPVHDEESDEAERRFLETWNAGAQN